MPACLVLSFCVSLWECVFQVNTFPPRVCVCVCVRYNRESLKVLGTVGEPINPEAWQWYYSVVGEKRCPVVDTFWQTETVSTHLFVFNELVFL